MSIEEKIKTLLAESDDEIKDVNDDSDSKDDDEANDLKEAPDQKVRNALIKKIQKALESDSNKTQTVNGVKGLSKADLEIALDCLNRGIIGNASAEVKQLLGNLVEETDDSDDEDTEVKTEEDTSKKDAWVTKIKKLIGESDDEDTDDDDYEDDEPLKEAVTKKDALVAKIKKALYSGSMKTQTINGVKNLSISDLELALEILNGEPVGYASKEVKELLGDLVEETDDDDEIEIKDIKEDINVMFSGETLNEDFKTKASTIFESAVYSRVKREVAKISEQLEKEKENELSEQKEQLTDLVDGYLGMVAEQWLNDNEIALENSLKTEMFENFITKMKTVFVESYIDVPDEKFDMLEEKENEVLRITEQLNKATDSLIQSRKVINTLEREKLINEATSKMSQTDKERFVELTEDYDFDVTQKDEFENRLEIIKESYFGANAKKNGGQKIISDNKVLLKENQSTTVHPDVAAYL